MYVYSINFIPINQTQTKIKEKELFTVASKYDIHVNNFHNCARENYRSSNSVEAKKLQNNNERVDQ